MEIFQGFAEQIALQTPATLQMLCEMGGCQHTELT